MNKLICNHVPTGTFFSVLNRSLREWIIQLERNNPDIGELWGGTVEDPCSKSFDLYSILIFQKRRKTPSEDLMKIILVQSPANYEALCTRRCSNVKGELISILSRCISFVINVFFFYFQAERGDCSLSSEGSSIDW